MHKWQSNLILPFFLVSAYKILDFFSGDEAHEKLFEKQAPFFKQVKIEFYKNLWINISMIYTIFN